MFAEIVAPFWCTHQTRRRANSALIDAGLIGGVKTESQITVLFVLVAIMSFFTTAKQHVSIVGNAVALSTALGRTLMTRNQLQREVKFGGAMAIADRLLAANLITQDDYKKISKSFSKKYAPVVAGSAENPRIVT